MQIVPPLTKKRRRAKEEESQRSESDAIELASARSEDRKEGRPAEASRSKVSIDLHTVARMQR